MRIFIKNILIFLFFLAVIGNIQAGNYRTPAFYKYNPIFEHIVQISPRISDKKAFEISNIIAKYTKKYHIEAELFTAILRQESNFRLESKGCRYGLDENYNETKVCADFGISQVYYKTARRYKFDIERLTKDLDYSIKCGIIILRDIQKRYGHEKDWWTRYNCGTRGTTKRDTCQIYKSLVSRYFRKDEVKLEIDKLTIKLEKME